MLLLLFVGLLCNLGIETDGRMDMTSYQGHSNRVIVRRTISARRLVSLSASRQTGRFPTILAPIDPDSINKMCFSIEFVVFQEEEWNLLHIHTVPRQEIFSKPSGNKNLQFSDGGLLKK